MLLRAHKCYSTCVSWHADEPDHAAPEELAEAAKSGLLAMRPSPVEEAAGLPGKLLSGPTADANDPGNQCILLLLLAHQHRCDIMLYELSQVSALGGLLASKADAVTFG